MAISATAGKKEIQYVWEGKDKRGNKVRGKSLSCQRTGLTRRSKASGCCRHSRQDAEQARRR